VAWLLWPLQSRKFARRCGAAVSSKFTVVIQAIIEHRIISCMADQRRPMQTGLLTIAIAVLALIASFFVPEVRAFFGLNDNRDVVVLTQALRDLSRQIERLSLRKPKVETVIANAQPPGNGTATEELRRFSRPSVEDGAPTAGQSGADTGPSGTREAQVAIGSPLPPDPEIERRATIPIVDGPPKVETPSALSPAKDRETMPVPSTDVAIANVNHADGFVGTWRGRVKQQGAPPYSVVLTLRSPRTSEIVGDIEYPEVNCRGTLDLVALSSTQLSLHERIVRGRCVDGGTILITRNSVGSAHWEWSDGVPRDGATASITLQ
jgi:hypothetical protein